MSESIEIEFKNMLTNEEYDMLIREFNMNNEQLFTQENHYFDTLNFSLKELGAALRIRVKNNHQYEMTLKQSASIGLLETTQSLSEEELQAAIQFNNLPGGIVLDRMEEMGMVIQSIKYFGSLTTERVELTYRNGLLVLDHSFYLNKEDFELEYEVEDYQLGQQIFLDFLDQYQIPQRKTDNKVHRFYRQKYFQSNL